MQFCGFRWGWRDGSCHGVHALLCGGPRDVQPLSDRVAAATPGTYSPPGRGFFSGDPVPTRSALNLFDMGAPDRHHAGQIVNITGGFNGDGFLDPPHAPPPRRWRCFWRGVGGLSHQRTPRSPSRSTATSVADISSNGRADVLVYRKPIRDRARRGRWSRTSPGAAMTAALLIGRPGELRALRRQAITDPRGFAVLSGGHQSRRYRRVLVLDGTGFAHIGRASPRPSSRSICRRAA